MIEEFLIRFFGERLADILIITIPVIGGVMILLGYTAKTLNKFEKK